MAATPNITPSKKGSTLAGIMSRAAQIVLIFVVQGVLLFAISGRLDWTWAWVFLAIYVLSVAINSAIMLRNSPETVAERGQASMPHTWDKVLSGLWGLMQFLVVPLVAALDARFRWSSETGLGWHMFGAVLFALGLALFGWAMITNAYFSTAVRIQSERGQTVCTSGPYRIVRHPGYAGTLLQSLGMPLLLGSWWAFIPALLAAATMTARAAFEDGTLRAELSGYSEFAQHVKYRLLPGIW